jgi:hypothetical protein
MHLATPSDRYALHDQMRCSRCSLFHTPARRHSCNRRQAFQARGAHPLPTDDRKPRALGAWVSIGCTNQVTPHALVIFYLQIGYFYVTIYAQD